MKNLFIRIYFFGLFWLLSGFVMANAGDPRQLVENTAHEMMDVLLKEKANLDRDPERIYRLVEKILLPHFDFVGMSRFVIGKHWKTATESERAEFILTFRNLLVRTYAGALRNYTGRKITVLPDRASDSENNKVLIRSMVENPSGDPILVNYRLWQKGDIWLVYDISVEGVSLLTNFRSQLSEEVSQYGMTETIHKMQDKTQKLKTDVTS